MQWLYIAALAALACNPARAVPGEYTLPLDLATQAALEAVHACEAAGHRVSVAVVDAAGQLQVQLKGERSTPHTGRFAFRKAYSVASFAPNYGLETSAEVGALLGRNPSVLQAVTSIPEAAPIPGAVAIRVKGLHVGAIGVSGAPGGDKDEACARAGIARIADQLPK